MYKPKQQNNQEIQPGDIPGYAVTDYLARTPASLSMIGHVVEGMAASQKIPVPLATHVERPPLAPVQQHASITNLAEYRNIRPVPTMMPQAESVPSVPATPEQQSFIAPAQPLTEAEAQVAMGQQALATISQLHDASDANPRQFGQEWQAPINEKWQIPA